MELKNALGWNQTPEDWQRFLLLSPQGCFKAMRAEELVATAVAHVFDRVCWIGMVIVKHSCRQQGVGRRMMDRCLEHSARKDCNLVVLDATRDGVSLYSSLGFRPEFLVGTSRGEVSGSAVTGEIPEHSDFRIRPLDAKDLDQVVSLEAAAVGAVREALLYNLVRQYPGCGFVAYEAGGLLAGFVLYRPGFHSCQVGPLIARNDRTAEHLLRSVFSRLSADGRAAVILTVPMNNSGMLDLLRDWGLNVEPRLTRMSKGRKRLHAREDMVYAMSGPEKG